MDTLQSVDSHDMGPTIKTDFLQITITADNQPDAVALIRLLTEKRLVACAQIQGYETAVLVDETDQWRCRFKTSNVLYEQVCNEIALFFAGKSHTLKCLPIVKGSQHFLNWLKSELKDNY